MLNSNTWIRIVKLSGTERFVHNEKKKKKYEYNPLEVTG